MISRNTAFLLAFLAALIYGISFTVAKDVMPLYIKPYGFILLRISVGVLVFWMVGLFLEKESIKTQDFARIFLAAVFGIAVNMLAFFKGLSMTSPISAAVIMVTTPIMVLSLSTIFLKEKATLKKVVGILIGLLGAILLIVYGKEFKETSNARLGNLLIFVNATSYALYLIIIKNLTNKYHPLTLVKWLYLFGLILVIPFGFYEFKSVSWSTLPLIALYKMGFIVIFTTVLSYMFNIIAIKKLKPTTLSIFIYLQPVIASIYALIVGSDALNLIKILATILIFLGVYLVTRKPTEEIGG